MPDPTPEEIEAALLSAYTSPKKASNETGSVEAHSLADMIEFDRYIRARTGAATSGRGLRFTKLVPPGVT